MRGTAATPATCGRSYRAATVTPFRPPTGMRFRKPLIALAGEPTINTLKPLTRPGPTSPTCRQTARPRYSGQLPMARAIFSVLPNTES